MNIQPDNCHQINIVDDDHQAIVHVHSTVICRRYSRTDWTQCEKYSLFFLAVEYKFCIHRRQCQQILIIRSVMTEIDVFFGV